MPKCFNSSPWAFAMMARAWEFGSTAMRCSYQPMASASSVREAVVPCKGTRSLARVRSPVRGIDQIPWVRSFLLLARIADTLIKYDTISGACSLCMSLARKIRETPILMYRSWHLSTSDHFSVYSLALLLACSLLLFSPYHLYQAIDQVNDQQQCQG